MKNSNYSVRVILLITLIFSFNGCSGNKNEEVVSDKNTLFDWVDSVDSVNHQFEFRDKAKIKISISEAEIERAIPISEILQDFRFLQIKNEPFNFIGEIDKILAVDSLILVLDIYVANSLHLFNAKSGEEMMVFKPSGEGPGEMMTISDFDILEDKIFIHDEQLAKILVFDRAGNFILERKLPLRSNSFKLVDKNTYVFSCVNNPNGHLGSFGEMDLIVLDSLFKIKNGFQYSAIDQRTSDFLPRDLMRFNFGNLSYFPRFSNSILLVDVNKNLISNEIEIDLGGKGLLNYDLNPLGENFVENRKKDKKFFGFGHHFITDSWIGMKMDRFGGPEFQLFYHRQSGKYFSGSRMDFDFRDLIFFSFPLVCHSNTCISVIDVGKFKNIDLEKFFSSLNFLDKDFSSMRTIFESIEDFDQPLLLIVELKN